jgi:photosystem II stability/assembly factor-like uncharacterized protein
MSFPATVPAAPIAAGTTSVVSCLTVRQTTGTSRPGPHADRGPCTRPETQQLIPVGPDPTVPPTLLTNFGLVFQAPGGSRYELVCDDYLGGRAPLRVARRSDGQLLVPGVTGLYATTDGQSAACGIVRAEGSLGDRSVADVAIAPAAAGVPAAQSTVWALSGELEAPRSLHVSSDGGASFSVKQTLSGGVFARILVAPSDPRTLYVAGYQGNTPLVLLESSDGGDSFTSHTAGPELFARSAPGVEVLGVHPTQPRVLLLAAGSPSGADEIWRSTDGGASWTKVFTLQGMQVQSGFLWRTLEGGGEELLIAGRELFRKQGQPPAHLYRSRDGGLTFEEPIASPDTGPRYRCLAAQGSRLFACAGDDGDSFMTGYSDDGGRSWVPLARLTDVEGSRPCAAGRCLTTAIWLCETYGAACAGLASPDAASIDAPTGPVCKDCEGDGCGCELGAQQEHRERPIGLAVLLAAAVVALARRRRATARGRCP